MGASTDEQTMRTVTEYEVAEVQKANADGTRSVVFVRGLWLLPNAWEPLREVFEEAGHVAAAPEWPDDPTTWEARTTRRWSRSSTAGARSVPRRSSS
jgi:hypothetical protein